jgi:hypothetical protein
MGIGRDNALNYKATGAKTKKAFNSVSDGIARYRSGARSASFVESEIASGTLRERDAQDE